MRKGLLAAATALLLTASWVQAQDNPSQNPASAAKPGAVKPTQVVDEKPITALPYTPSLDVNSMDKAALKRRCEPEDLAEVIVFLGFGASMVTGQTIVVDGGLTL